MGQQRKLGGSRPNKSVSFMWIQHKDLELMKEGKGNRRVRNQALVKEIGSGMFEVSKLGVLIVGPKGPNGKHKIADGQHRYLGLKERGWRDEVVPCLIVHGAVTDAELAEIFIGIQHRVNAKPVDSLLSEMLAQHPEAVMIQKVLERRGLRVYYATTTTTVSAAAALRRIYRAGGEHALDGALEVASTAWGRVADAWTGDIIEGLGMVLARHPDIEKARFAKKLALKYPKPNSLRAMAQGTRVQHGSTLAKNVAGLTLVEYNAGARNRLPDWWAK